MSFRTLISLAAVGGILLGAATAQAAGDPAKGKKVFNKCKACHLIDKEKNRVGPHLKGVIGRKAGDVAGYKYSKAMMASGLTWDDATLDKYLAAPKKLIKGTKMAFPGLKKETDRANVIAYIKQAGG